MAKKFFTDESLATFVDEVVTYTNNAVSTKADSSHNHAATDITSGTLSSDRLPTVPIEKGGTGATTAAAALTNLGITATASELNKLDGVTATTTELNYVSGVTSNIQTQLDEKATQEWVLENAAGVGKSLEGQTVKPKSTNSVTAGTGAEIFNDYRDRTFDSNGVILQGNIASGEYSHAEGNNTTASGRFSHAEGISTTASGDSSHAEGSSTNASGHPSHAEGGSTKASGNYSHAEGNGATASGLCSHAEGNRTTASGSYSHAEGWYTTASGSYSHAGGYYTIANNYQYVVGKYNADTTAPTGTSDTTATAGLFIVGIGTSSASTSRANGFRVNPAGKVYGVGTFGTTGADYAEYFEWFDGNIDNEDRRGHFVALEGDKIRYATPNDDYILGVVSAEPSVAGDVQSEDWHNRYLKDVFGSKIVEVVEVEETTSEDGEIIPAHTERRWVLNPDYDPDLKYTSREERPEWAAIGIVGKLVAVDDGTCQVNGYCYPNADGVATASQEKTNYRVMERLDDTHIRIFIR